MNWDKHLVGRSFISCSFQFEFHYFSCLPGEGKNILCKHSLSFSSFPDRCMIRKQHLCSWLHIPGTPIAGSSVGDNGARGEGAGESIFPYLEIKPVSLRRYHSEMCTNSILPPSPSGVGVEVVVGRGKGMH